MKLEEKMKILICICLILNCAVAYADIEFKTGYIHPLLKNASDGWYKEVALIKQWKNLSLEMSGGHYATSLQGQAISGEWRTAGTLNVFPVLSAIKGHWKGFFFGGGIGANLMNFSEKYDGKARVKNAPAAQCMVGYRFNDKASIEIKRLFSDLNIESGTDEIGISEDISHLHAWVITFNWRF